MRKVVVGEGSAPTLRRGKTVNIRGSIAAWLVMLPALLLLFFLVWRPMVIGLGLSFFKMQGYTVQGFAGLDNYKEVIGDPLFLKTLANTFSYVIWSLVIGYLLPVIVACLLNEVGRGQGLLKTMLYLPFIVPGIAVSMIWQNMYQPDAYGLFNKLIAMFGQQPYVWLQDKRFTIPLILLSNTWRGFGSTMLFYLAAVRGVDQQLYEAARIDGAGAFRRVWKITLPQIRPVMLLMLIQQIIGTFQIMTEPMTMTGGGPNNASVSLSLAAYQYAFQLFKTGSAMATGAITFVILMILTVGYMWLQRKLEA